MILFRFFRYGNVGKLGRYLSRVQYLRNPVLHEKNNNIPSRPIFADNISTAKPMSMLGEAQLKLLTLRANLLTLKVSSARTLNECFTI